MTKKLFLIAALICGFALAGHAQGVSQKLAIGVEAGTYGPGITLATSLSPNFKLKVGLDRLNLQYLSSFDIDPEGYVRGNSANKFDLAGSLKDPEASFSNLKVMIDCYPMRNGIFSLSIGMYAGKNTIAVSGKIDDYRPDIVFDFDDAVVEPNSDGTFDAKLNLGGTIKPYVGFGLGRTIANSRIGFKVDFGLVYQGDYKFDESKNVSLSGAGLSRVNKFVDDLDVPAWALKCWPMINVSLSCRLF
jgi:hypothetical protein